MLYVINFYFMIWHILCY